MCCLLVIVTEDAGFLRTSINRVVAMVKGDVRLGTVYSFTIVFGKNTLESPVGGIFDLTSTKGEETCLGDVLGGTGTLKEVIGKGVDGVLGTFLRGTIP